MGICRSSGLRNAAIAAATLAGLAIGTNQAAASPGCVALQGSLTTGGLTGSANGTGFSSGDVITVTIVNPSTLAFGDIFDVTTASFRQLVTHTSFTYTLPSNTSDTLNVGAGVANPGDSVTWSCASAPAGSGSNDSQNLQTLQVVVTKTVAAISGHAITSAIDTALGDAFNNAGNPITPSPNGFAVNFAAEPRSAIQKRTDDAFAALGYAGMPAKAPPRLRDKDWSVWADVRGSGFDHDDAANTHGRQVNITGGVGRKLSRDLVVGLFGGYENFNYTMDVIVGRMTGSGGTIGAYAGWRLTEHWRLDGKIGWSDVGYDGTAGTASGSFRGSRWLAAGGFTGQYGFAAFFVEPSARIYALWESENAYTDSLGAVHPSRQFSEGNVSAGAKLIYPMWLGSGRSLSPYLGLYTDYRFSTDNALPVAFADAGIKDGWSERVSAGLALACGNGATFAVGGELAGLGAGYQIWSATARVNWRF